MRIPAEDPRPIPAITPAAQGYWSAAARRELALAKCAGCNRLVHLPRPVCPFCGGSVFGWQRSSGRGRIHTFSVVHRSTVPGFRTAVPYVVAWIDLDGTDGVRAFGNVLGCPVDEVRIGMRVELCFEELDGFGPLPNFTLAR